VVRPAAAALAAALAAGAGGAAAARDCAAALVLALDVSSSVDAKEYALQMGGLAAALRHPEVVETIAPGGGVGIMAAAFAWSGFQHQEIVADWTWLGDRAAIEGFARRLETAQRRFDHWPTALGRAAAFAAQLHAANPTPCQRRITDVSGDGANNDGVGPDWYRERGQLEGMTINGLVILGADPDPATYYRDVLIQGPGAFVEIADSFDDYAVAILRKLLRELQPAYAAGPAP
jgi:hypothetical protein